MSWCLIVLPTPMESLADFGRFFSSSEEAAVDDQKTQVWREWSLPPAPPLEVTRLRCDCCVRVWERDGDLFWRNGSRRHTWRVLFIEHATLPGHRLVAV